MREDNFLTFRQLFITHFNWSKSYYLGLSKGWFVQFWNVNVEKMVWKGDACDQLIFEIISKCSVDNWRFEILLKIFQIAKEILRFLLQQLKKCIYHSAIQYSKFVVFYNWCSSNTELKFAPIHFLRNHSPSQTNRKAPLRNIPLHFSLWKFSRTIYKSLSATFRNLSYSEIVNQWSIKMFAFLTYSTNCCFLIFNTWHQKFSKNRLRLRA